MATTARLFLLLGTALVGLAVGACAADAISPGSSGPSSSRKKEGRTNTDDTDDATEARAPSGNDTDTSPTSPDESPAPTPTPNVNAATCGAKADLMACIDCCSAGDDTAFKAADDAFKSCACGAGGACRTACASDFCAGKATQPSNACLACLEQRTSSCDQAAEAACEEDAACKAASACATAAKCGDKPET